MVIFITIILTFGFSLSLFLIFGSLLLKQVDNPVIKSPVIKSPVIQKIYVIENSNLQSWRNRMANVDENKRICITDNIGIKYFLLGVGKHGISCSKVHGGRDDFGDVIYENFNAKQLITQFPDYFVVDCVTESGEKIVELTQTQYDELIKCKEIVDNAMQELPELIDLEELGKI